MKASHPYFGDGSRPWCGSHCDDVTSFQCEHSTCVQGTLAVWWFHRRYQGYDFAVHTDVNPPIVVVVVDLGVYEVATRDRNGQFSISIRHTADEMAVGSTLRPVFDNYRSPIGRSSSIALNMCWGFLFILQHTLARCRSSFFAFFSSVPFLALFSLGLNVDVDRRVWSRASVLKNKKVRGSNERERVQIELTTIKHMAQWLIKCLY